MYERETEGVLVRAAPMFLASESDPEDLRFVWAYTIEIENRGAESVQLLRRRWTITEESGLVHEVEGEGVVGKQPVIRPGERFSYTSAAPLSTPSGVMVGAYAMVRLDSREAFEAAVPAFALDSPHAVRLVN